MQHFFSYCQTYSGAIQVFATVVLIGITGYYARLTYQSLRVARDQLAVNLVPQIAMNYELVNSLSMGTEIVFVTVINIMNGGAYPFTILSAQVRIHGSVESLRPTGVMKLPGLTNRVISSHDGVREELEFKLPRSAMDTPIRLAGDSPGPLAMDNPIPWNVEMRIRIHDALNTHEHQFLYDTRHGLRRASTERFYLHSKLSQVKSLGDRLRSWIRGAKKAPSADRQSS